LLRLLSVKWTSDPKMQGHIPEDVRIHCKHSTTSSTKCNYLLTLWSRVLLQKLPGSQLVKKFPAFYGTRRFITAFASARHLSLSWAQQLNTSPLFRYGYETKPVACSTETLPTLANRDQAVLCRKYECRSLLQGTQAHDLIWLSERVHECNGRNACKREEMKITEDMNVTWRAVCKAFCTDSSFVSLRRNDFSHCW